jgi:hypothetical protein
MDNPPTYSSTHVILPIEIDPSQAIEALEKAGVEAEVVPYTDDPTLQESTDKTGISVSQADLPETYKVLADLGQSDVNEFKVVQYSVRTESVNWLGVGIFFLLLTLFGYLAWRMARFFFSK